MEVYYLIVIFCVSCYPRLVFAGPYNYSGYYVPVYGICLIAITILILILGVVLLSLALYNAVFDKQILGLYVKKYLMRQETNNLTLSAVNCANDEHNDDRGSALTNSAPVEIYITSEPDSPTLEYRRNNSQTSICKKPHKPIDPEIGKKQMDELCKQVLSRKPKTVSATFRELDEIMNRKSQDKNISKNTPDGTKNESNTEINKSVKIEKDNKPIKPKKPAKIEVEEIYTNADGVIDADGEDMYMNYEEVNKIKAQNSSKDLPTLADEQEVYDTLPDPVRCKDSEGDCDIPVYDLPPSRNFEEKSTIVIDKDTQYLIPIRDNDENARYVNARRRFK